MSSESPAPKTPPAPREPVLNFIYKLGGKDGAAALDVYLADDEMSAYGDFIPPSPDGKVLVYPEIEEVLYSLGITAGIHIRMIQECIYRCNVEKRLIEKALLAQGIPPKSSSPAFLKLEPQLFARTFPEEAGIRSVDYKNISPFVIVKKGELLARAVLPRAGVPGQTVKANPVAFGKKDVKFFKPGPHTIYAHGKVFAKCAGRFFVEKDVFDVSDTLEVQGGVDYSTGHIIFPGNIIVGGPVKDGFKLVSGLSILVKETLDASEVMCKKDLVCQGGIIGKKPGIIRVGARVKAQFVENCQLEALGDLFIAKNILGAKVFTNGRLVMEEGAKIVASLVWVKGNVLAHHLGNETGHCHLVVGSDFALARRLEQLRNQYREEEDALNRILERSEGASTSKVEEIKAQVREKILLLVQEINQIQETIFNPACFEVRVRGGIFPGTVIEMGYARLEIHEKQTSKVFRLSDDRKSILVEKFDPKKEDGLCKDTDSSIEIEK